MSIIVNTYFNSKKVLALDYDVFHTVNEIKQEISRKSGLPCDLFSLILNGKYLKEDFTLPKECVVHAISGLCGGKGGFGSMLRAIGAQIQKTTNRGACRDLNGRRLRDVLKQEQLLKALSQKEEDKKDPEQSRIEKLEKICQDPKAQPLDEAFIRKCEKNAEKISEAIIEGLALEKKRKADDALKDGPSTKRQKRWIGFEEESDEDNSDSDEQGTDEETESVEFKEKTATELQPTEPLDPETKEASIEAKTSNQEETSA